MAARARLDPSPVALLDRISILHPPSALAWLVVPRLQSSHSPICLTNLFNSLHFNSFQAHIYFGGSVNPPFHSFLSLCLGSDDCRATDLQRTIKTSQCLSDLRHSLTIRVPRTKIPSTPVHTILRIACNPTVRRQLGIKTRSTTTPCLFSDHKKAPTMA